MFLLLVGLWVLRPSLLLYAGGLDHLRVLVDFGTDELAEFLGGAAHGIQTVVDEALLDVAARENLADLGIPPRHDLPRRLDRRHQAEPRGRLVAFQPGLIERRDLGQRREALQAADADGA